MQRDDPAAMSIDERLGEIASLLAIGFLRLKRRTCCLPLTQRLPQSGTDRAAIRELRSDRCVKGLPPAGSADTEHCHSLAAAHSIATSESAESSKIPADSTCHLSENSALCAAEQRGLRFET